MDNHYKCLNPAEIDLSNLFVEKPRSLILDWEKEPEQSVDALKLDNLLLALTESDHISCPAHFIESTLPSLSHAKLRNKVLKELNSLVLISFNDRSQQLKVYEYVRCHEGQYTWAYTLEYITYFLMSGITFTPSVLEAMNKERFF